MDELSRSYPHPDAGRCRPIQKTAPAIALFSLFGTLTPLPPRPDLTSSENILTSFLLDLSVAITLQPGCRTRHALHCFAHCFLSFLFPENLYSLRGTLRTPFIVFPALLPACRANIFASSSFSFSRQIPPLRCDSVLLPTSSPSLNPFPWSRRLRWNAPSPLVAPLSPPIVRFPSFVAMPLDPGMALNFPRIPPPQVQSLRPSSTQLCAKPDIFS